MAGPWERYAQPAEGPWSRYAESPAAPEAVQDQRPKPVDWDAAKQRTIEMVGGAARGLRDPIDAGAQVLTRGLEAASGVLPQGAQDWIKGQRESVESINRGAEQDYRQNWLQGKDPGLDVPRIVGNVAATAPIAAAIPGVGSGFTGALITGALQGGVTGALQPVDTEKGQFWPQKGDQVATGAGFGAAGAGLVDRISAAISPKIAPEVQSLLDRGVSPTPGQVLGGSFKRAEEGLTSVPVLGDAIKSGQRRAIDQFNTAVLDDALAPIGKALPKGMEAGRDAVSLASKMISDEYDNLLPKLTATVDRQFADDLANLTGMTKMLPPEKATQFANILDNALTPRMASGASGGLPAAAGQTAPPQFTGEGLKEAQSRLSAAASRYMGSGDADQRMMGEGFQEAVNALRGLVQRSNPQYAAELKNIDTAYANFLRAQTAAARTGAKEGVFSPAQYSSAVREMDKSLRKSQFARGNALGQDLATDAERVLGSTVPDSGTPFRLMNLAALGGGAMVEPTIPMAAIGASAMYTPTMQKMLANALANRPAGAQQIGQQVKALSPLAAALLAGTQQ